MISKVWLKRQSEFFLKNIRVDNTPRRVYHISLDPALSALTPRIAHSQSYSEDRSVPRICVSLSVADAIFGYGRLLSASFHGGDDNEKTRSNKDPVFHIYSTKVEGLVHPNKKLCGDAEITGEAWIVADKVENTSVEMNKCGEFFISNANWSYGVDAKAPATEVMIQVSAGQTLHLEKDVILKSGWYKGTINDNLNGIDADDTRVRFEYAKCSRDVYMKSKAAIKAIYSGD